MHGAGLGPRERLVLVAADPESESMNTDFRIPRRCIASLGTLALVAGLSGAPARAALGGVEASVESDRQQIGATARVLSTPSYTMHELQTPSGTVVREYVSPEGTVFGVAWHGPSMPDLRQLLGAYFDRYVEATARRGARGPVAVQQSGLVVQSAGHMRAFVGRAYLPDALPQGVVAGSIQ